MLGFWHLVLGGVLMAFLMWRGLSFWQALMSSGPAVIFIFFAWSAMPVYKQHGKLIAMLEEMDPAIDRAGIKQALQTNGLTFLTDKDVKKVQSKEGRGFKVAYSGKIDVLPSLQLEIRFDQVVMGR